MSDFDFTGVEYTPEEFGEFVCGVSKDDKLSEAYVRHKINQLDITWIEETAKFIMNSHGGSSEETRNFRTKVQKMSVVEMGDKYTVVADNDTRVLMKDDDGEQVFDSDGRKRYTYSTVNWQKATSRPRATTKSAADKIHDLLVKLYVTEGSASMGDVDKAINQFAISNPTVTL